MNNADNSQCECLHNQGQMKTQEGTLSQKILMIKWDSTFQFAMDCMSLFYHLQWSTAIVAQFIRETREGNFMHHQNELSDELTIYKT